MRTLTVWLPSFWRSWGRLQAGLSFLILALVSCDNVKVKPHSQGELCAVTLVGDRARVIADRLGQDMPGLPLGEPMFDVTSIDSLRFTRERHYTHNIVIVTIRPDSCHKVSMRYEQDVWAKPQLVVHITAPSVKTLRDSMDNMAPALLRALSRSEIRHELARLSNKRNAPMEKNVHEIFGLTMWVPAYMKAARHGQDFLWLSDNSTTMMRNIVIYRDTVQHPASDRLPGESGAEDAVRFTKVRDNALGSHIKGETDDMHMKTVAGSVTGEKTFMPESDGKKRQLGRDENLPIYLYRGQWEIENDIMGGPFVSRVVSRIQMSQRETDKFQRVIVEGFVYAPGKKKRDAMRKLEAILYTAHMEN